MENQFKSLKMLLTEAAKEIAHYKIRAGAFCLLSVFATRAEHISAIPLVEQGLNAEIWGIFPKNHVRLTAYQVSELKSTGLCGIRREENEDVWVRGFPEDAGHEPADEWFTLLLTETLEVHAKDGLWTYELRASYSRSRGMIALQRAMDLLSRQQQQ